MDATLVAAETGKDFGRVPREKRVTENCRVSYKT